MRKTSVKFNEKAMRKQILDAIVPEQTKRLVEYAKEEIYEMIATRDFHSRTFNLADSYVWAVYYNGKEQEHGFVGGKMATSKSYLHEYSKSQRVEVDGRKTAQEFLNYYRSQAIKNGWTIVWAACAPYAVYLDPAVGSTKTNRFFVISQRYDHIKGTLEPKMKVELKVLN